MVTNYKQVKEDVLKQYDSFLTLIKNVKENGGTVKESSLTALENQATNIREDKFFLMVVGEAKSGKSTFINAYLGKEILPMDVKQCTSAIVEIRYGKKFILKATYADEREEVFTDEDSIKRFLADNASIDDEYRDIPVPTINIELLMSKCGKTPLDHEIKDLLKGIESENMYHLTDEEYEKKIRKYIEEKTPHWMDIVKKIEIEYPFDDEDLKGIEIIDTPGVNADGRVGDMTHAFLKKANAVMFLKPLIGSALEASSFKRFLEKKSTNRNRDALFLILTRAANETPENISRIHDEAFRQFTSISEHQIIHLDSKVELFYNRIKDMSSEELEAYMTPLIDEEKLDSFLETPWYKAKFQRDEYLKRLKELSNFDVIDESLNQFAHKAHYMAFRDFLERMIKVLDAIRDQMSETLENYKKKAKDPVKLGAELANKKDALEALKLKINTTASDIGREYTISGGLIEKKAEEVMGEYSKEIGGLNESSSDAMEDLKNITFRKVELFVNYQKELVDEIVGKCDRQLVSISGTNAIPFKALQPDLTPEAIERIKSEQESHAYETKYTDGGCFKKPSSYPKFSQSKFFKLVRDDIELRLKDIKSEFIILLSDFVTNVLKEYRNELVANAELVQKEYDKILNDKAEAEELQEKIVRIENVVKTIDPIMEHAEHIKRGVNKHV